MLVSTGSWTGRMALIVGCCSNPIFHLQYYKARLPGPFPVRSTVLSRFSLQP
uniref:Uncharacterized protein n=1 Tax=Anguilla anguilla TaxID=7936 RepID=A0A0E9Q3Q1_ANGAN